MQETYGTVQRLDLKCGNGQLGINYDGSVFVNGKSLLGLTYPVGSIYMSVNATSPQTLFRGHLDAAGGPDADWRGQLLQKSAIPAAKPRTD